MRREKNQRIPDYFWNISKEVEYEDSNVMRVLMQVLMQVLKEKKNNKNKISENRKTENMWKSSGVKMARILLIWLHWIN